MEQLLIKYHNNYLNGGSRFMARITRSTPEDVKYVEIKGSRYDTDELKFVHSLLFYYSYNEIILIRVSQKSLRVGK